MKNPGVELEPGQGARVAATEGFDDPSPAMRVAAAAIVARGARLEFLPPYSPEFNPIEEAWSKMKGTLRRAKARTIDTLVQAVGEALEAISPADCHGWFTHAGYATT